MYAPSEENTRQLTSRGCQCHVEQLSASSFPLTPGLSSSKFEDLPFACPSPMENVLLPNPLQIKILPVTSPAATILWVGWKAKTVKFFVWWRSILLSTTRSDSISGTFHMWSFCLSRMPKNSPEELMVIYSGFLVCEDIVTSKYSYKNIVNEKGRVYLVNN